MTGTYPCKLRTLKAKQKNKTNKRTFFTASRLQNLVGYSYLVLKHHVKMSHKRMVDFFSYFTFCKKGILNCKSMEIGIKESAIAIILHHYDAHCDL